MLRNDYIIFGGVDTRKFQVGIFGDQLAEAPERDIKKLSVPGKNGDVVIDNGRYKNIRVKYKAYIIDKYNANIRGLRNAFLAKRGYQKLEDTVNPNEYRLAMALPFEPEEYGVLRAAEFELEFDCKPQRFLKSGEQTITLTAESSIYNAYEERALPLIRAYGTGTFTIGGVSVQITSANSYTDIDCETMEAYKDTMATNCNGNIVLTNGVFPYLDPGINSVSMTGITQLDIVPRWWIL